jgi:tetratricopeptide (TPR) repeat protein
MEPRELRTSDTKNWEAFHLATDALRDIDRFVEAEVKDRKLLVDARQKLQDAIERDHNFLRARYYGAIVDDMLGHSNEAAAELSKLIHYNPAFREEAEYNLAVCYYHIYSRREMEEAMAGFQRIVDETRDPVLKYMANAGLIRSYSMMVLHELRERRDEVGAQFFAKAIAGSETLLTKVATDATLDSKTKREILWRIRNGRGVGFMFHSDKESDLRKRKDELRKALEDFEDANTRSPHNWEVVCNLGSVHMRLGDVARLAEESIQARREFDLAKEHLSDVLEHMRPDYGFALYELGRVFRLEGNFGEAQRLFAAAMKIPERDRNIGDKGLRSEIDKASKQDSTFS